MAMILRHSILVALVLQSTSLIMVSSAKQKLQLSDSYLPVAMQIIAHITDQLTYEANEPAATKPTTSKPMTTTNKRPSQKPTTATPYVVYHDLSESFDALFSGWWMSYRSGKPSKLSLDLTTPLHKPGLYAPQYPPKPEDRKDNKNQQEFTLQPVDTDGVLNEGTLISIQDDEVDPAVVAEPSPDSKNQGPLPNASSRSDDDEYREENLQYLYPNVRDLIRLAHDPDDERLIDVWGGERSGPPLLPNKAAGSLSASHLRLLLLYDLLSREAKKQNLSEFHGFSDEVLQNLEDTSNGGARAQLSFALSKMLERHDCGHDYANNRAREIVAELKRDDSKFSSELRYLNPLRYVH